MNNVFPSLLLRKGRLWVFFGVTVKRLDMFFRLITGKIKILKQLNAKSFGIQLVLPVTDTLFDFIYNFKSFVPLHSYWPHFWQNLHLKVLI